uniref:Uncharacterized protein n=1 Tax=Arundo donax TaxID=35708 RepID=A0A0A8YHV8_ARUDO
MQVRSKTRTEAKHITDELKF